MSEELMHVLPEDFDPAGYLAINDDVRAAGLDPARHYLEYGIGEGRRYRPDQRPRNRHDFLQALGAFATVLEIGPFDNPMAPLYAGPKALVEYADWQDKAALKRRASAAGRNPEHVPHIAYVTSGSLSAAVTRRFGCVVSSHMVEHAPDLVTHLREVHALLEPGGTYIFIVPDKRHCFDRFLPESALPEVIAAYLERRTRPPLRAVVEHRAFTVRDYENAADPLSAPSPELKARIALAEEQFRSLPYVDVHCWQFTPLSLTAILRALVTLDLLPAPSQIEVLPLGKEIGCTLCW